LSLCRKIKQKYLDAKSEGCNDKVIPLLIPCMGHAIYV